jgi:hypothetical protein
MKVFLDDVRDAPKGWILAETVEQTNTYLRSGIVTHLSLDHDLGFDCEGNERTGYEVLCWIEWQVIEKGFIPPILTIHSANPVGRAKMLQAIKSIERYSNENNQKSSPYLQRNCQEKES